MGLPTGTIDTITFHIWEGQVLPMQDIVDIYRRVGQPGEGAETLGQTAIASPIRAFIMETTIAGALTDRDAVLALQGQFLNITQPNGDSFTGALIAKVVARISAGHRNFNGTSYPLCVAAEITIKAQQ